jgi:hypothetical protein
MNDVRRIWRFPVGLPQRTSVLLACGATRPVTPGAGSWPSDCNEHPSLPGHVSTRRVTIPNAARPSKQVRPRSMTMELADQSAGEPPRTMNRAAEAAMLAFAIGYGWCPG